MAQGTRHKAKNNERKAFIVRHEARRQFAFEHQQTTNTTITLIVNNCEFSRWLMTLSIILKICIKIIIIYSKILVANESVNFLTCWKNWCGIHFNVNFLVFVVCCVDESNVVTLKPHRINCKRIMFDSYT